MIIALVLSVASLTILTFLAGYRLALHHQSKYSINHMQDRESLEPVFAKLDREYKYTSELNRSFIENLENHRD